jgi:Tol biopolymer transport system component
VRLDTPLAVAAAIGTALVLSACGSSDGRRADLLLVSTREGDYAIYAMSADGGKQERLTEVEGDPSSPQGLFFQIEPAWSPDGSRIAFASKRAGSFDVYVMNADGTGTRRLTRASADEGHPTWSPDGERIAFSRGTSGDLYVVRADGSGVRPLANGPADDAQPAWSPDGRSIAFVRRPPGTQVRELWVMGSDGSEPRRLTRLEATSSSPAWSPDGTRIAFSTNSGGKQFDIYFVVVAGKSLQQVTTTPDDSFEPTWSPDGTKIAYAEGGSIFSVEPEGDPRELSASSGNDSSPAWNPSPPDEG